MQVEFKSGLYVLKDPADDIGEKVMGAFRWNRHFNAFTCSRTAKIIPLRDHCVGEAKERLEAFILARTRALAPSIATDANIRIPVNAGMAYRGYQKAGIAYAQSRQNTLIGDAMRLGKTIQAIGVCNTIQKLETVLVICPAGVKINWLREMNKWLVHPLRAATISGDVNTKAPVTIINYDILWEHMDYLRSIEWDVIIIDEAHYLRTPESGRSVAVLGGKRYGQGVRGNFSPLKFKHKRLFLSGTIMYGRTRDLFNICKACDPHGLGRNKAAFERRYCDGHIDEDTKKWVNDGSSNQTELQILMRERFMIRREKTDVASEIPPQRQNIILSKAGLESLVEDEKRIVSQEIDTLAPLLSQGTLDEAAVDELLRNFTVTADEEIEGETSLATARKALAMRKLSMCFEFIDNLLLSEKKIVVMAYHRCVIDALQKRYDNFAVKVYGGMTQNQRQTSIDQFVQNPDVRIFNGNIIAAGQGINLSVADTIVFLEQTWIPSEMDQAEERVWDVLKKVPVTIYKMLVEDSLDLAMDHILTARQKDITKTMVASSIEGIKG